MSTRSPYRDSQVAIDDRRAANAGITSSQERYDAWNAANRAQADAECKAFYAADASIVARRPVDEATLDLALAWIARHGEGDPPTLYWHQLGAYRETRTLILAERRKRRSHDR